MARSDKERVRHAQVAGAAKGVQDALARDTVRRARLRDEWPELVDRLELLFERLETERASTDRR